MKNKEKLLENVLERLRKETGKNITQSKIADDLGLTRQYISQLKGKILSDEYIETLERIYHVDLFAPIIECVEIDYIHIAPSCGKGTVVLDEADVTPVRIGKEIIKDIWKVSNPDVLKLFKASGDSMETTIEDGNILLVDTSRTDYHNGGIYVLTINNDWFVKRLRLKINGDLEIISDNPKYDPEVLKPNTDIEINVVGRVIKNLTRGL